MAHGSSSRGGEGLSLQTLVIAAAAAGTAAVVTSHFWQRGTLISAAMTPVIVTVVSEMLKRPAQSVRRAAASARSATPARSAERQRSRRSEAALPLAYGAGAGSPVEGPSRELPAPPEPSAPVSQIKVYRSTSARRPRFGRVHWKIVLATAAIAFAIAAAALTLPELLFGQSVSGGRETTFFGGAPARSHSSSSDKTKTTTTPTTTTDKAKTTTSQSTTTPTQTAPSQGQTTSTPQPAAPQQPIAPQPSAPPPSSSGTPAPQDQQQAPQQQSPAPSG
jgi:hypothetical protein